MHPTQLDILNSLRRNDVRQFNELLHDVAETSDNLTYHLKRLQNGGYISSPSKGEYALAEKGLIYLNNNLELNHDLFPTVSCMLELHGPNDTVLVMRKLKQPYLGSIHLPTFGVISSQSLQSQIDNFLERYHITTDTLTFRGLHRERVQGKDRLLVFDKFFAVFHGAFTSFEERIDDRKFMAIPLSDLSANPHVLSASQAVLALDPSIGFTEDLLHPSSTC